MTSASVLILLAMVAATTVGAITFKQFVVSGQVFWLIAGLIAYNASNIAWILLIEQSGLGRAAALAAASQILILTIAGALFGEAVGKLGWLAAIIAGLAVLVSSLDAAPTEVPDGTRRSASERGSDE